MLRNMVARAARCCNNRCSIFCHFFARSIIREQCAQCGDEIGFLLHYSQRVMLQQMLHDGGEIMELRAGENGGTKARGLQRIMAADCH